MKTAKFIPLLVATMFAVPVFAQTTATETQRDVNQQQRIENGLKSGQLTTHEAAKLEGEQAHVDRAEAQALKDGKLTGAEKTRIAQLQNKASKDINAQKHDAQTGNPNSRSSQRMQADVQRNVNQEKRIENGMKAGTLTNQEVGKLERGQARVDRKEQVAGRDGHVGVREQRHVQRTENRQSRRIKHEKTDQEHRG